MDGTLDASGDVPDGHYRVVADGLPANASLVATVQHGDFSWNLTEQADAQGTIDALRMVESPEAMQVLDIIGSADWTGETGLMSTSANGASVTISVQ